VVSVQVLAEAVWCTVSTVARSAGVCGGSGAVCRGWLRVVQSADDSDITVLTDTAVTALPSASVASVPVSIATVMQYVEGSDECCCMRRQWCSASTVQKPSCSRLMT
jgi:hypothetical protein